NNEDGAFQDLRREDALVWFRVDRYVACYILDMLKRRIEFRMTNECIEAGLVFKKISSPNPPLVYTPMARTKPAQRRCRKGCDLAHMRPHAPPRPGGVICEDLHDRHVSLRSMYPAVNCKAAIAELLSRHPDRKHFMLV